MQPRTPGVCYLQFAPLTAVDERRILQNRNNPVQTIKVSSTTRLQNVAGHIQQLAGLHGQNTTVVLYVPYQTEAVQLPLGLTVAEFCLITSQHIRGELRYSFTEITPPKVEVPVAAQVEHLPPPKLRKPNPINIPKTYPPPPPPQVSVPSIPVSKTNFQPPSIPVREGVLMASPILHTGFSLFSNSFGGFPGIDTGSSDRIGPGDTSVSLRKGLEQILSKA